MVGRLFCRENHHMGNCASCACVQSIRSLQVLLSPLRTHWASLHALQPGNITRNWGSTNGAPNPQPRLNWSTGEKKKHRTNKLNEWARTVARSIGKFGCPPRPGYQASQPSGDKVVWGQANWKFWQQKSPQPRLQRRSQSKWHPFYTRVPCVSKRGVSWLMRLNVSSSVGRNCSQSCPSSVHISSAI